MYTYKSILIVLVAFLFVSCALPKSAKPQSQIKRTAEFVGGSPAPDPVATVTSGNKDLGRVEINRGSKDTIKVESHSYKVVVSEDELLELPPLKTYVLLPRDLSKEEDTTTALYRRYARLLSIIQQEVKVEETGDKEIDNENLAHENVFLLFSKSKSQKVTVKNYNYAISNKILKFFKKNFSSSIFREDGPFLITTTKNIEDGVKDFTFLYVNLSKFNKSAVDEMVGAYKERLEDKGDDEIATLEKLHSKLLAFVTNFGSDVQTFQSALIGLFMF